MRLVVEEAALIDRSQRQNCCKVRRVIMKLVRRVGGVQGGCAGPFFCKKGA